MNNLTRGSVVLVNLDPTIGTEIKKTRPVVVVSNDMQNKRSQRIVVLPMTSNIDTIYSFDILVSFAGRDSKVLSDQIRTIDKTRIIKHLGILSNQYIADIDKAIKLTLALS